MGVSKNQMSCIDAMNVTSRWIVNVARNQNCSEGVDLQGFYKTAGQPTTINDQIPVVFT